MNNALSGASPRPVPAESGQGRTGPHLRIEDLRVSFGGERSLLGSRQPIVKAVDGVTLEIARGQTLGIVGESGSGKTTVGRAVVGLNHPSRGRILLDDVDLLQEQGAALRRQRRRVQMIFQDPYSSLDPRQVVHRIIEEPLVIHRLRARRERERRVVELLEMVGLDASHGRRYPHQLSGGQRQRVGIARALAVEPELIVLDEPVSALDVSIQAQIVNLLAGLQERLGVTFVFIGHDLAVVRHIAHRVAVMYLGRVVEAGSVESLFSDPQHPYTAALLSAVPMRRWGVGHARQRIMLAGEQPGPSSDGTGCPFTPRCWLRSRLGQPDVCDTAPVLTAVDGSTDPTREVACHFPGQIPGGVDPGGSPRTQTTPDLT